MNTHSDESVITVVMVCAANICRSPAAASLLRAECQSRYLPARVVSRGVWARPGQSRCLEMAELAGHTVEPGTSDLLTREDVANADLILTAELAHRSAAVTLEPRCRSRAFTLLEIASLSRWWDTVGRSDPRLDGDSIPSDSRARSRWWFAELDAARGIGSPRPSEAVEIADPHGPHGAAHPDAALALREGVDTFSAAWERALVGSRPSG